MKTRMMKVMMKVMMMKVLGARLLLAAVVVASASPSPSDPPLGPPSCPPRWFLFGTRCFALYPVWSSWTHAQALCSQSGGFLPSVNSPEDQLFVRQLTHTHSHTHTAVWLGGRRDQQSSSWSWSDSAPFRLSGWTNQSEGETPGGGACMTITPHSGELHSVSCDELNFYICSTKVSPAVKPHHMKPTEPGLLPGVLLVDVVWSSSYSVAEEILSSSSFLQRLASGRLTPGCYDDFQQQEELYLNAVSSTLQALIGRLHDEDEDEDEVRSLLLLTHKLYSSRIQTPPALPPRQWLLSSLKSFHAVVQEDPVYVLVALSARVYLRHFLSRELPDSGSGSCTLQGSGSPVQGSESQVQGSESQVQGSESQVQGSESQVQVQTCSLYRRWSDDAQTGIAWIQRYRTLLDAVQMKLDVFKAINVFRSHMINQRHFYTHLESCDEDDGGR